METHADGLLGREPFERCSKGFGSKLAAGARALCDTRCCKVPGAPGPRPNVLLALPLRPSYETLNGAALPIDNYRYGVVV